MSDFKVVNPMDLSKFIDHSCLTQTAKISEIETLCSEAILYKFNAVCVNSQYVSVCARKLKGHSVQVISTVGFPLGTSGLGAKAAESRIAIENGANVIEVALAVGLLKSNSHNMVEREIAAVVKAAGTADVKVIIESGLLTKEEIVLACKLSVSGGAKFIKTSTGFAGSGASVDQIKLIKQTVGGSIGVTASGGIRTFSDATSFLDAGASTLGVSTGPKIINTQLSGSGFSGEKE